MRLTLWCHWAWLRGVIELNTVVSLSLTTVCGVMEIDSVVSLSLTLWRHWAWLRGPIELDSVVPLSWLNGVIEFDSVVPLSLTPWRYWAWLRGAIERSLVQKSAVFLNTSQFVSIQSISSISKPFAVSFNLRIRILKTNDKNYQGRQSYNTVPFIQIQPLLEVISPCDL